ncbi:MAG: putative lipid II flippase FtsW [Endomicrobium sp.]|jgi:cell division protein FtsW|nr:putative lipid II flippase FtsW [Endomicrobium sp.]
MFKIDFKKYDSGLIIVICICTIFGSFMVFSSSNIMAELRWASPYKFFLKQLLWIAIGFILMFITSFLISYNFYKKYSKWIYLFSLILIIIVLFAGTSRSGAKRWLTTGYFSLQPSELAKIATILITANFISKKKIIKKLKASIVSVFAILLMVFPIAMEPDLGTPILIAGVCSAMLFCAEIKMKFVFTGCTVMLIFIIEEIIRKPYRRVRFKDYIASFINIDMSSYQVRQSINALGSGGFFGKGLGKSEIKLMYLPEAHTDFIFPIIGEELGFIGTSIVLVFFMYLFFKGVKMSKHMPDIFSQYLCLGITFLIVFQAIINISAATGVFPAKGLPLPFISFGGTSLIMIMAAAGILINLSQYEVKQKKQNY